MEVIFLCVDDTRTLGSHMKNLLGVSRITVKSFQTGSATSSAAPQPMGPHILLKVGTVDQYRRLVLNGKMRLVYLGFNIPVYVNFNGVTLPPPAWSLACLIKGN